MVLLPEDRCTTVRRYRIAEVIEFYKLKLNCSKQCCLKCRMVRRLIYDSTIPSPNKQRLERKEKAYVYTCKTTLASGSMLHISKTGGGVKLVLHEPHRGVVLLYETQLGELGWSLHPASRKNCPCLRSMDRCADFCPKEPFRNGASKLPFPCVSVLV